MRRRLAPRWAAWAAGNRGLSAAPAAGNALGVAPDPTQIEWCWIRSPLTRKPTTAITKAQITQTGGTTAYSTASADLVDRYGVNTAQVTLDTACDADPPALAAFLTTYQSVPRPRQPELTFDLTQLDDAAVLTILGVEIGSRAVIVNGPATMPAGAASFVVEGIGHVLGVDDRLVVWQTAAVVGEVAGTPGPWFRWDSSYWDGPDIIAY